MSFDLETLMREKRELENRRKELTSQNSALTSSIRSKEAQLKSIQDEISSIKKHHSDLLERSSHAKTSYLELSNELTTIKSVYDEKVSSIAKMDSDAECLKNSLECKKIELLNIEKSNKENLRINSERSQELTDKENKLELKTKQFEIDVSKNKLRSIELDKIELALKSMQETINVDKNKISSSLEKIERDANSLNKLVLKIASDEKELLRLKKSLEDKQSELNDRQVFISDLEESLNRRQKGLEASFEALEIEKKKFQTEKMRLFKSLHDKSATEAYDIILKEFKGAQI